MSFRDDADALFARVAALEEELERAQEQVARVHQLEAANAALQAKLAQYEPQPKERRHGAWQPQYLDQLVADAIRQPPPPPTSRARMRPPTTPPARMPVPTRAVRHYLSAVVAEVQRLVETSPDVETALPIDAGRIEAVAEAHAADLGHRNLAVEDLEAAVRDVLTSRLIARPDAGRTIDEIVEEIVAQLA